MDTKLTSARDKGDIKVLCTLVALKKKNHLEEAELQILFYDPRGDDLDFYPSNSYKIWYEIFSTTVYLLETLIA